MTRRRDLPIELLDGLSQWNLDRAIELRIEHNTVICYEPHCYTCYLIRCHERVAAEQCEARKAR